MNESTRFIKNSLQREDIFLQNWPSLFFLPSWYPLPCRYFRQLFQVGTTSVSDQATNFQHMITLWKMLVDRALFPRDDWSIVQGRLYGNASNCRCLWYIMQNTPTYLHSDSFFVEPAFVILQWLVGFFQWIDLMREKSYPHYYWSVFVLCCTRINQTENLPGNNHRSIARGDCPTPLTILSCVSCTCLHFPLEITTDMNSQKCFFWHHIH